jgi:hypothetical protein
MRILSVCHGLVFGPVSVVLIAFTAVSFAGYTNSGLENIVISTDLAARLIEKEDEIENSIIGFLVSPAPATLAESIEISDDPPLEPETDNGDTQLAVSGAESTPMATKPEVVSPDLMELSEDSPELSDETSFDEQVASAAAAPEIEPETVPEATSVELIVANTSQQENSGDTIRIDINKTIQGWAFAWSSQDVPGYLAFYADEFTPDNPQLSRSTWAVQREERLLKPGKIELGLSNIEIYLDEVPVKRAEFEQTYKSDVYQDKVLKSLEFIEQDGEWKIRSERTVKVLQ